MEDLNALAIKAKTCEESFQLLLQKMKPTCVKAAYRYRTWMADYDEIFQLAQIEVWNAVKTFEAGKMPFELYCQMTVMNHIKSKVYRLYGKANFVNRTAYRLEMLMEDEETTFGELIPKCSPSIEQIVCKDESIRYFHKLLHSIKLTNLEFHCLVLFYFQDHSYSQIQQTLALNSRKPVDNALVRIKRKLGKNKQLKETYHSIC
jgi:RNA polymerase sporulation-specific sigma factor